MNWLVEPWHSGIFVRGVLGAVLAGGLCGVVGTYVVLRRMSYIGHGLSHAVFGGAVVGYVAGTPIDLLQRIEISPSSVSTIALNEYETRLLAVNNRGELI